jgi:hypothetical protein
VVQGCLLALPLPLMRCVAPTQTYWCSNRLVSHHRKGKPSTSRLALKPEGDVPGLEVRRLAPPLPLIRCVSPDMKT